MSGDFLCDAEHRTESWQRRHSPEAIAQLGVWRWKGIQKHAGRILDLICGKRVIDFGGADGPLGFGAIIVDSKSEYKTLSAVPGKVDVIFTSHTLEHLDELEAWIIEAHERLRPDGRLIVHVPAWTCARWRADEYMNPRQPNGHKHTLGCKNTYRHVIGLRDDFDDTPPDTVTLLDVLMIQSGFIIELAEYVGDNSIMVIARK